MNKATSTSLLIIFFLFIWSFYEPSHLECTKDTPTPTRQITIDMLKGKPVVANFSTATGTIILPSRDETKWAKGEETETCFWVKN